MTTFDTMKQRLYAGIAENFGDSEAEDPCYNLDFLTWTAIRAVPHAIQTADEARELAIDYQNWASEQNLSYGEVSDFADFFRKIARDHSLTDEFTENGLL